MTRQDFLTQIKADERLKLTDFGVAQLQAFLHCVDDTSPQDTGLLEHFTIELNKLTKARIYVGEFFDTLKACLAKQAAFLAQNAKIKNFKGTRYEELELLKAHFLRTRAKELGLGWIL